MSVVIRLVQRRVLAFYQLRRLGELINDQTQVMHRYTFVRLAEAGCWQQAGLRREATP